MRERLEPKDGGLPERLANPSNLDRLLPIPLGLFKENPTPRHPRIRPDLIIMADNPNISRWAELPEEANWCPACRYCRFKVA